MKSVLHLFSIFFTLVFCGRKNVVVANYCRCRSRFLLVGLSGQVHAPFWAPSNISYAPEGGKTEEKEFPMPESKGSFNFVNSVGLSYEAAEVRRCLKGMKESPLVTHEDSMTLARLEVEIRRQLKVHYPQDD